MFLVNFIFVVSHLKIHPAVHLNTSKALTPCSHKEKFIKATDLMASNFINKEIPTQVFSCEYCEIFKTSFFEEHLWRLFLSV